MANSMVTLILRPKEQRYGTGGEIDRLEVPEKDAEKVIEEFKQNKCHYNLELVRESK